MFGFVVEFHDQSSVNKILLFPFEVRKVRFEEIFLKITEQ